MAKLRDEESFRYHMENTVARCAKCWVLISKQTVLGEQFVISPRLCKSNYCKICRAKNLRKIRRILIATMAHDKWRLVTLTYPQQSQHIETILQNSYQTFRKFLNRIRRRKKNIKYIRTLEIHKNQFPHFHMVVNKYIPFELLRQAWQDLGGGIVDIRASTHAKPPENNKALRNSQTKTHLSYKTAARYLTEEIEKQQQDPHNLGSLLWRHRVRTITTSRNIKLNLKQETYKYHGTYNNLTDAMWCYEMLKREAADGKNPIPGINFGSDAVLVGPGFELQ